jgi:hypothetical protein
MLPGVLLTGFAVFIRRWLVRGPGGIRHGFTAERLSGKDKIWMNAGSAVLGVLTPESITPAPQRFVRRAEARECQETQNRPARVA